MKWSARTLGWALVGHLLLVPLTGLAEEQGVQAEDAPRSVHWLLERTKLEALWYLHYLYGEQDEEDFNRFRIGRGYTTVKFKPVEWFDVRSTLDIHETDGGWVARLKYLYGRFTWPIETTVVSNPALEFGMGHIPWLGYEESINRYRMQGTMFLERNGIFNSADLGLTVATLLGEPLPSEVCDQIDCHYPGTWGSLAVGVYNGGGYHDPELNDNKVVEARVSVRPAGPWLPNLSLSYVMVHGVGNTEAEPDWTLHGGFASFEHTHFVLTGQVATGEGNQDGDQVDPDGTAHPFLGASGFAEVRLLCIRSSVFGRYDWFRWEPTAGDDTRSRVIAGAAFWFYRDSAVVLDYDRLMFLDQDRPDDWQAKLTVQVYLH